MRIPTVSVQPVSVQPVAVAARDVPSQRRRPDLVADAPVAVRSPLAGGGPFLPEVIADRLAGLLALDPGLAEAVTARLPEARLTSAHDLATYVMADGGRRIDLAG